MAIANAVQKKSTVFVYNEKNQQMFTIQLTAGMDQQLLGFTGSTVTVRKGSWVYMYNDKGQQIGNRQI